MLLEFVTFDVVQIFSFVQLKAWLATDFSLFLPVRLTPKGQRVFWKRKSSILPIFNALSKIKN